LSVTIALSDSRGNMRLRTTADGRKMASHSSSRRFLRGRIAVLAVLALTFGGLRASAQETGASEYQLKAAFLFNFAKFVGWPPSSFASPQAPFTICLLGADPFGQVIEETLRGQMIRGRRVTVQRARNAEQLRQCQMVFISSFESARLPAILHSLRGASVLVVGETPGFAAAGGAIQFDLVHDHVRFSINPAAAERAGLRVSSTLLSLATIVHDAGSNGKG
jgi:YfiR/HmsC-like